MTIPRPSGTGGMNAPDLVVEPLWKRLVFWAALLVFLGFFWSFHHAFWSPAHGGVDQHGYLVGGKMVDQRLTTGMSMRHPLTGAYDPYLFVGAMWVGFDLGTPNEQWYPKYPIGLPVLYGQTSAVLSKGCTGVTVLTVTAFPAMVAVLRPPF